MRYEVTIKEERLLTIDVEADSDLEALMLAEGMYGGGEIDLGSHSGAAVTGKGSCGSVSKIFGHWEA